MITGDAPPTTTKTVHALWERLTRELADVLDAHGICAAVAYEIAVYSELTVVVGLSDPQGKYYDVWVCPPNGNITQARWPTGKASFRLLSAANRPLVQQKYQLPPKEVISSELWLLARDEVLFVPLPFPAGRSSLVPAGALCLIDPPAGYLFDITSIEPLAIHISTFLERAFLRHRTDRQEVEFAIVYDLTSSLTSTLSLDSIFSQITDPVRRILNVETVSIGLVEPASGDIIFVDMLMGPLFRQLPTIRLKPGQGIAGWVASQGEPVIINNVQTDERFYRSVDHSSGFRTNSILCVPLRVEQRVIGVLEAINKQDGNFSDNDLRLLQAITGPLAAALENAWLHADVLAEKRRIETIFANMSEGMLTVNAEGRVTAANDAFLSLAQVEVGQLLGRLASEVIHLNNEGGFAALMARVIDSAEEVPHIACELAQGREEQVPVLVSGAPIHNEANELSEAIYVFSDLRQIREVERMRDDFFHNIVHELRTPLATILMYARLLREGKARDDSAKADRFLGVIERESDRLQRMVRQMLQVAKLNAREIQRSSELVRLNAVFDDMLPPLAEQALQKGLTFSQRIPADLPPVMGNQETLYMIFKNLVDNAVKFTMSGTVSVKCVVQDESIQVEVRDEGIGIPRSAMPNLFKRFYRTQTAVERGIAGTGLGLYMVKEGVEKHGGSLDVQSVEGKGTTFTVRLPAAVE